MSEPVAGIMFMEIIDKDYDSLSHGFYLTANIKVNACMKVTKPGAK